MPNQGIMWGSYVLIWLTIQSRSAWNICFLVSECHSHAKSLTAGNPACDCTSDLRYNMHGTPRKSYINHDMKLKYLFQHPWSIDSASYLGFYIKLCHRLCLHASIAAACTQVKTRWAFQLQRCTYLRVESHSTGRTILYLQPINKLTSQCEIRTLWTELTTNNRGLSFDMSTWCIDRRKHLLSSKSSQQAYNWFPRSHKFWGGGTYTFRPWSNETLAGYLHSSFRTLIQSDLGHLVQHPWSIDSASYLGFYIKLCHRLCLHASRMH